MKIWLNKSKVNIEVSLDLFENDKADF